MIEAHQHPVSEVLGDKFLHEIPAYQRPYAWTADEAQQLLLDLQEAVEAQSSEPYFLGSIVLIRPKGEKIGQVVDGQQRLTTLTILAAVLRDAATDDKQREALSSVVYIEPNEYKEQVEAVRLLAHEQDRIFFREAIQMPGATAKVGPPQKPINEAQEHMWDNARALAGLIKEMDEAQRKRLVTFLLNKCILVVVSTESRAAALRIFRVLNDRGMDLSNADVIKADLLAKFKDQGSMTHHAGLWRQFETDLGREEFESLLEVLRFVREEGKNRRTLSEAFAERFRTADAEQVRIFFNQELTPANSLYSRILDKDASSFPLELTGRATEVLEGLALVPNRDWTPVATAAWLKLGSTIELVECLERLEGLAWVMQLARRYDTQRMNRYVEVLRGLKVSADSLSAALTLLPDEASEAWQALQGPLYGRFPTRVVRAILERLDRLLAEQPVSWAGQKTVEHILPQSPEAGAYTSFTVEHRLLVTHTLGNLVLLTSRKNSGASNLAFPDKVKVYFGLAGSAKKRATYASAQELAHLQDWNLAAYQDRQGRHAKLLAERWSIKTSSVSASAS